MSMDLVRLLIVLGAALLARAGQEALDRCGRRRARKSEERTEPRREPLDPRQPKKARPAVAALAELRTAPKHEAPRPLAPLAGGERKRQAASRAGRAHGDPRQLRRALRLAVVLEPPRGSPPENSRS